MATDEESRSCPITARSFGRHTAGDLRMTLLGILLFLGLSTCSHAADILTVYSDVGISGDTVYTWCGRDNGCPGVFDGSSTDLTPPEGTRSWKASTDTWDGWGVFYNSGQNFSAYAGGELRFWVNSDTGDIKVEIKSSTSSAAEVQIGPPLPGWNWNTMHNTWTQFRVALPPAGYLTSVSSPFAITYANSGVSSNKTTFYTDFIRWVPSGIPNPYVNVTLKNISNNVAVSSVTFFGGTANGNSVLPGGWTVADQYIQVDLDPDVAAPPGAGWGVQIYTDNTGYVSGTGVSPNPKYTGTGDPAGLVDESTTTKTLSMAWSVKDTTTTVPSGFTAPVPTADDPNAGDANSYQWLYMKDAKTSSFHNGDAYITALENLGFHYASGDYFDSHNFGPANTPHRIYLEANFAYAVTPRAYQTNELIVEFYHD